ncbi:MAG TPA: hypothetical protein VI455_08540, partial [Terriglobia bacterium]
MTAAATEAVEAANSALQIRFFMWSPLCVSLILVLFRQVVRQFLGQAGRGTRARASGRILILSEGSRTRRLDHLGRQRGAAKPR